MSMNHMIFGVCCVALGAVSVLSESEFRMLGGNQGYEPEQPIPFSHRLHAGELAIDCQYCHYGARQSRNAGVPSASICMNCHNVVTSGYDAFLKERELAKAEGREAQRVYSPGIEKLLEATALGKDGRPLPGKQPEPIDWVRVHNLPDFVYFDHRPHVARNIACETCHGPVGTMDRMRQESTLSMGWCIDCHRTNEKGQSGRRDSSEGRVSDHVSTNCVTCHL